MEINASGNTKNEGILIPKINKTNLAALTAPVEGTLVYVNDTNYTESGNITNDERVRLITSKGFHYYDGTIWRSMLSATGATFDYVLSSDTKVLIQWLNKYSTDIDMNTYPDLSGVKVISQNLLQKSQVQSFTFTDGVTTIGDNAFANNPQMTFNNLPSSLVSIGESAFHAAKKLTTLNLPNVTSIGGSAFNYSGLTTVSLPSVKTIDKDAFRNSKLTSVSLPVATDIGVYAFAYIPSLTEVSLPAAVTIGNGAFEGSNNIRTVTIGPSVRSIGSYIFYGNYDYTNGMDLTLTIQAPTPPSFPSATLKGLFYRVDVPPAPEEFKIKVPTASVDRYKAAWPDLADYISGY